MTKSEKKLREEIFKKIVRFYKACHAPKEFIPGTTPVKYGGRVFDEKELVNLIDASLDFWLTSGRYAASFEKKLAEYLSIKYCMLTNSGSSANLLAVTALTSPQLGKRRLKAGDEVITTACGFPTTLNPIIQNNLTPVFVDVELGTYNIRADIIEKAVSKKTKAIFIPHTLGNPAAIDPIIKIARKYNLWFVEDNCDSLGSVYRNAYTGTFGDIATCSFYPPHHITMGEGGAVLTDSPLLKKIILSLRDWGRDCWCESGHDDTCHKRFSWKSGKLPRGYDHKYIYSHVGYNLRVTDMQAAIGLAQLDKLAAFTTARKKNFQYLYDIFKKYERYIVLPRHEAHAEPSWFGFPIFVKNSAQFTRDDMVRYLESKRITTRMLFGGNLTKQPAYMDARYRIAGALTNTDEVMNRLFWIGVYPGLTPHMLHYVEDTINNFFKHAMRAR